MKFKSVFALLAAFLISVTASAQMVNPVKWTAKAQQIDDITLEILFTAQVDDGWHIYDLGPYQDGPIPLELALDLQGNAELVGKPYLKTVVHRAFDDIFQMEIGTCEGVVILGQKVTLKNPQGGPVKATLSWQSCNDTSCLPPADEELTVNLPTLTIVRNDVKPTQQPEAQATQKVETPAQTAAPAAEIADSEPLAAQPSANTGSNETSANETSANETSANDTSAKEVKEAEAKGEVNAPAAPAKSKSLWGLILEAVAWGFVMLLTPCVFPMVPMTVSFFLKGSQNKSKAKGRAAASFFGLCIVALYTLPIAAIIFITWLAGGEAVTADIFNWLATHWIPNLLFFLIFMVFAASFFGAFEIVLPSWMVNKSDAKSDKGGLVGIFFMALTLVLVSFSCTGPIVGSVLIKSTQGGVWEPIITMLAFSIAFALPFTIFAFAPSLLKDLPKSGGWLNSVKVVLGFIEVALGFKFLSVADQTYHWGLLDREVYLAIWIVVFTLLGLYLLGKIRFANDSKTEHLTVFRLTLVIVVFTFVVYMIPGMWGAPLKALSGYLPPITTQDFVLGSAVSHQAPTATDNKPAAPFKAKYSDFLHLPNLDGFFDYAEAVDYAKKVGKPLFIDFTGHGCVNCREMEMRVWSDPRVHRLMSEDYVIVALYADDKKEVDPADWVTTESGKVLKSLGKINSYFMEKRYNVNAQPYYIILDPATEQIKVEPRGYNLDIEAFVNFLEEGKK